MIPKQTEKLSVIKFWQPFSMLLGAIKACGWTHGKMHAREETKCLEDYFWQGSR
jgi:hypothetical protein